MSANLFTALFLLFLLMCGTLCGHVCVEADKELSETGKIIDFFKKKKETISAKGPTERKNKKQKTFMQRIITLQFFSQPASMLLHSPESTAKTVQKKL